MKLAKYVTAVALIAIAGSAFAQLPYPEETPFVSHKTRAEVIAELKQARDSGELSAANDDYPTLPTTASTETRAQVEAQLAANTTTLNLASNGLASNTDH